jgi:hypothetical protein
MQRMTLLVCLLGLSLVSRAQGPAPTPPTPAKPADPNAPAVVYDEGPLRAEIIAMREVRMRYNDTPERSESESNFAMLVRIRGERLKEISRYGNVILSEVVDDSGRAMLDPNSITDEDRNTMRPQSLPAARLQEGGLQLATRPLKMAARVAKTLKHVRGEIKIVMAGKTEKVTIVNPSQYEGKALEHPRLSELGIEVRVVPASELETPPPGQSVVLQYKQKADNVQSASFYDAAMKPLRSRERPMTTKAGEKCVVLLLEGAGATNEMQLVLDVSPTIESLVLPVTGDDLPLP